ncbi:hypothetical protein AMATHDRAFT_147458 [Amanita thiersii Skay4041]|uniref:Uncharacterized protein n=1 Tax=Amanita thiersii Skay4041 TaxID=703135 RepID=A0A2A9NMT9_9AGAR|nr:hypothetical protein AMATHDRAFT_147458 [Amanita thiersii Skay4041]
MSWLYAGDSLESHFLTHIPHPIHRNSEMKAILSVGLTSIHNFPEEWYQYMWITSSRTKLTHSHHRT